MMMNKVYQLIKTVGIVGLLLVLTASAQAQVVGVKTNILYLATASPNIGIEWPMGKHFTGSLGGGYNPFRFGEYQDSEGNTINSKLHHWMGSGEVRYWFCERFVGWNMGVNVFGGEYNVGGISFIHALKENRFKGWGVGAGVTVGYQVVLSARWGLDFSVGGGYVYTEYSKYEGCACGEELGRYKKRIWGLTKGAVSVVYFLR